MILPAILLLAAGAARVDLVDEVAEIPAAEWRYVELSIRQIPATVIGRFGAPGSPRLRAALLRAEDLHRLKDGRPHGVLAVTPSGEHGDFRFTVAAQGDYAVLLDHRDEPRRAARVHLRISLDFGAPAHPPVRYLAPGRRLAVILLSFAFFFGVLSYAGFRLLRAPKR